jgi:hypothetical protein
MAYLGNAPARSFISFERQVFTIVNSQTAYTLSHSVNNENDIRLVINNIVQEPGSGKAYTASGTTLTLSAALTNGTDEMYCVFLGRAVGTNSPGAGSVNTAAIADSSVSLAKLTATGTKDSTTFLRGDNTFAAAGSPSITDNGNATAITIDSSENVGIGTSSPAEKLDVYRSGSGITTRFGKDSIFGELRVSGDSVGFTGTRTAGTADNAISGYFINNDINSGTSRFEYLTLKTVNTERMRIDSSGRVAIGSSTETGARLYVPADGQTTDAWVRHGITSSCSGNWGGSKQVQVDWQIVHSVSYVFEFLTASYGAREHFVVGSYTSGSSHQTIMTQNGSNSMTQGGASSGERWTSSGGTHGVYCCRITSATGLDNALVTLI